MYTMDVIYGCLCCMPSVIAQGLCNPTINIDWKGSWQITWPISVPEGRRHLKVYAISERCWDNFLLNWRSDLHVTCSFPHAPCSCSKCSPEQNLSQLCQAYGGWSKIFLLSTCPLHIYCLKTAFYSFKVFSYLDWTTSFSSVFHPAFCFLDLPMFSLVSSRILCLMY